MSQPVQAVAKPDPAKSLKSLLDASRAEIEAALPKHITPDRMARIALTEARKNPALLRCDQASFLGAVIQASQLGLEPGGALGHCYLIPFKNNKMGREEVQFLVGYRGMLDLINRSGRVSNVMARAVYSNDKFDYAFGLSERLEHVPNPSSEEKLTHVYCVATLADGRKVFDVMTVGEVEAIRSRSKAGNSGPWQTDYEAMAKKSVIRRLFKYLPVSVEVQRAIGLDELADAGESQRNGSVIETSGRSVDPKAQAIGVKLGIAAPEPETSSAFDSFEPEDAGDYV